MGFFLDVVDWSAWRIAFWAAFLPAAVLAKPFLRLLILNKSRQTVSKFAPENHQVKQGTPTMGGILILIGALFGLAAVWAWAPSSTSEGERVVWIRHLSAAAVALFGFGLIGFVDDGVIPRVMPGTRGLGWMPKLAMQFVFALGVSWMLFAGDPIRIGLTVFLVLFFSNAYNFSDGLDGLAGSLLLTMTPGFLLMTMMDSRGSSLFVVSPMMTALVAVVGATIPFLFLNAPPAKVFMGDVGSLPIGALLGLCYATMLWPTGIAASASPIFAPGWVALVVLAIPMICELVPVPIQIFSVKVFKRKVFPYTPIHHAFEKAGWPETRVVWAFALFQLLCTLAAVTLL